MRETLARVGRAAIFSSGFRPFYLLGALYAPLLALGGAGAYAGLVDLAPTAGRAMWHGHEMLFGFATAIAFGTVLTALPSWAGIAETRGWPLAVLALAWLLGRVAFWALPWLPPAVVAVADLLLWPLLLGVLARPVWRAADRRFRLLLPIVLAMTAADLAYHVTAANGDVHGVERALRAAVWALALLFTLKGGVLTPIFTGNALRDLGRGDQARFVMPLEAAAVWSLVLLAASDLCGMPDRLTGSLALACAMVHAARALRWRGWRVADQVLLPSMHLAFVWLIMALVLKAVADLAQGVPRSTWLHAFTVGALGMMMISLMTRVSLRHTGRAMVVPSRLRMAAMAIFVAAALRMAATVHELGVWAIGLSACLWAAAFMVYLQRFAGVLCSPSLPRDG